MNKTILITGATSGIGREFAFVAASHNYHLILVARREEVLQEIKTELEKKYKIPVAIIPLDLSKPNVARELYQKVKEQNLIIDILVNNAGFGDYGAFAQTDDSKNNEMVQLNITALTSLCRLFLPPMIARNSGKILNVASTAAFQPGPFMAVYFATKAYVLSLSEALAEETRGTGVVVSALCPGPTKTSFQKLARVENTEIFKDSSTMDAVTVAEIAYAGLLKNKKIIIPSWRNKIMIQSLRISPRAFTTKIMRKILE